jgi:hypothetical protein
VSFAPALLGRDSIMGNDFFERDIRAAFSSENRRKNSARQNIVI